MQRAAAVTFVLPGRNSCFLGPGTPVDALQDGIEEKQPNAL
jgi:hypothetical protein